MRVLIISQYFWPESFRINEIALTLLEKGVEVEVLTGKPNYPYGEVFTGYRAWGCQRETYQGINVNRIPLFPRGGGGWRLALNYLSFIVSGLIFAPWMLRNKKYDVIFVYAPSPIFQAIPASFLGWLKGCPVALWVQDLWPESAQATGYISNLRLLKLIESMVHFVYQHTDLLLVQSKAFLAPVARLAKGKSIVYYPNSVESTFYDFPAVSLPVIPGLADGFTVLFAGNVGVGQAVEVIVGAAEILRDYPDINFVVLGKGSRWDWMCKQIEIRGLSNLHLAGSYPVETMPGLMRQAAVLLVTLADQPIFAATIPNKIQAYMAVGKPILACLNGEGARIVREADAGLAVPAEDAVALADGVLSLYKMSAKEREKIGQNGRVYFREHFDHDRLADQLVDHLHQLTLSFGKE